MMIRVNVHRRTNSISAQCEVLACALATGTAACTAVVAVVAASSPPGRSLTSHLLTLGDDGLVP